VKKIGEMIMKLFDFFSQYKLTSGQRELLSRLEVFLNSPRQQCFLLQGYAGTGKTFITKGLTEYFDDQHRQYILAAPTGKASKVISKKTAVEAYTIHKTIYSNKDIKEYKVDNLDGTETYKFYYELQVNDASTDTVYIIDEASMIADVYQEEEFFRFGSGYVLKDLLKHINIDNNDHNKKIIFIGDNAQLPPVGMKFSPALDEKYLSDTYGLSTSSYELTEVVRQSQESGILENSIVLRNTLKRGIFDRLDIDLNYEDVTHVNHDELINKYLETCKNEISDKSMVIAYTNSSVKEYNDQIREKFFPGQYTMVAGDKVMSIANSRKEIFISNGDFGIVKNVAPYPEHRTIKLKKKNKETNEVKIIEVPLSFRDVVIEFRDLREKSYNIATKIVENILYEAKPKLTSDQNKAMYIDFLTRHKGLKPGTKEFKDTLRSDPYFNAMKIKFGYAITCHKAQGSEWNHVFVNCEYNTNYMSEGYFRWLYTAITRGSQKLYTLNEPHFKYGSTMKPMENQNLLQQTVPVAIKTKNEDIDNRFDIPETNYFLLTLLSNVKALVKANQIDIISIKHANYREIYTFQYMNSNAEIHIIYNGKNKITHISKVHDTKLADGLLRVLHSLEKKIIIIDQPIINEKEDFKFKEEFLEEQYKFLEGMVRQKEIEVSDVVHRNYLEKYYFRRKNEFAVFDFYYNGKKQFTSWTPEQQNSNSMELVNDIVRLLG
jgi:hypothetical protein